MLKYQVRKQDYVSRWGGEEFLLLLPDTGIEGAEVLAEKLRKAVEENKVYYYNKELKVTATLGVDAYTEGKTTEALIKKGR